MRDTWKAVQLGDVAEIASSGVDKHIIQSEVGVRLCNYLDVYRYRRLRKDMKFARGSATSAEVARFMLRRGDLVITKDSETPDDIGVPSLVDEDLDRVVCGYHLALVRPKPVLVSAFLLHYLQSDSAKQHFLRTANGLTRFGLGSRAISSLLLSLPPPDEQAAIARLLDAADRALDHTRAALQRARNVRRVLVQRLLSDGLRGELTRKTPIGLVPRSWQVVPVSTVVTTFQYGLSLPMESKGELAILRMGNIQDGDVLLSDLKFVTLPPKTVAPYRLQRGDVLFNRTNSQEWVGKVGIYRHDAPAVFASYLIRLLPDITKIDNYYLGHVLGSYASQCHIKRYATPGVQQVNINATNLGKVLIPLPAGKDGLRVQREIAALAEAADAAVRSHEPVLVAQQKLKAALMHDLLTGQIRVRDTSTVAAS